MKQTSEVQVRQIALCYWQAWVRFVPAEGIYSGWTDGAVGKAPSLGAVSIRLRLFFE